MQEKKEVYIINYKNELLKLTDDFILIDSLEGIDGIEADIESSKGMSQDGVTVENIGVNERYITITGNIVAKNEKQMEEYKRKILKILKVGYQNNYLYYKYGDVKVKILFTIEKAPTFKDQETWQNKSFSFKLLCPEVYWEDINSSKQTIASWKKGFHFPFSPPVNGFIFGYREPSLIGKIENKGDVMTGLIAEFIASGDVKNPLLYDVKKREYIKLNIEMKNGDVIRVNTNKGNKGADLIQGGLITDIFDSISYDSTFLRLDTGVNFLRFDAEEGLNNLEINIYFNNKYVGV